MVSASVWEEEKNNNKGLFWSVATRTICALHESKNYKMISKGSEIVNENNQNVIRLKTCIDKNDASIMRTVFQIRFDAFLIHVEYSYKTTNSSTMSHMHWYFAWFIIVQLGVACVCVRAFLRHLNGTLMIFDRLSLCSNTFAACPNRTDFLFCLSFYNKNID